MGSGIYIALSGAVAQSQALDIVANNVANASTTGFRAERQAFGKVLGQARSADQAYVHTAVTRRDSQTGAMRQTGNPLDLALSGDGFFAVDTPRGARYTRAGDFTLDSKGRIVNPDGFAARGTNGKPITIPENTSSVIVSADGSVYADEQQVGSLQLARFAPGNVVHEAGSLYAAVPGAQTQAGAPPEVMQGTIEQGSFNVVRGVVDLIKVSRSYESLHRMIESYKQIDDRTARDVGGPK